MRLALAGFMNTRLWMKALANIISPSFVPFRIGTFVTRSNSSVKGVAEVAPVGGFVKQYQVDLDPNKLLAYGIPIGDVVDKIRKSNADVGGKTF